MIIHQFYIPQLDRERTIRIFLPNAYYKYPNRRFSVIYAQDGQNLFDDKTSFAGAWKVGETINKLPYKKQVIVVGIDNDGGHRMTEYLPFKRKNEVGEADKYIKFLTTTLKSFIDYNYRTLPDFQHTVIMGSSLGGLVAFYGSTHATNFGKAIIFSPSIWYQPKVLEVPHYQGQRKIYVAGSTNESRFMGEFLRKIYWTLKDANFPDETLRVVVRERGKHNENFWAREFKHAIKWLFNGHL